MPPRSKKPALPDMTDFDTRFGKLFGEGTLTKGDAERKVISTGSLKLDSALGVGGYVEGRLYEFWGVGGIGKTTFALLSLAEAQRAYPLKYVGFVDVEQTFDPKWAAILGVDLSRLRVYNPYVGEDVADAMKEFIRSGHFSMIVLDSIGAMISKAEMDKDAEEATVGKVPGIVTRMVKIAATECRRTGTVLIIINQVRANIARFGPTTTTGGGWALKHVTTGKIEFKGSGTPPLKVRDDGQDIVVGRAVGMKIERNKCAPSGRVVEAMLMLEASEKYGPVGIDRVDEAIFVGKRSGVIQRGGAWYTLTTSGERFNGEPKLIEHLREHPDEVEDIREAVLKVLSGEVLSVSEEDWDQELAEAAVDGSPAFDFRSGTEGLPD